MIVEIEAVFCWAEVLEKLWLFIGGPWVLGWWLVACGGHVLVLWSGMVARGNAIIVLVFRELLLLLPI